MVHEPFTLHLDTVVKTRKVNADIANEAEADARWEKTMKVFSTTKTKVRCYSAAALAAALGCGSMAFAATATNSPVSTLAATYSSGLPTALSSRPAATPHYIMSTEVREVRSQSINGSQVLMLQINAVAGPSGCQSSTVTLRSSESTSHGHTEHDLEALALRAMLNAEEVFISMPTSNEHCVDGRPTVTDLWLRDTPSIG